MRKEPKSVSYFCFFASGLRPRYISTRDGFTSSPTSHELERTTGVSTGPRTDVPGPPAGRTARRRPESRVGCRVEWTATRIQRDGATKFSAVYVTITRLSRARSGRQPGRSTARGSGQRGECVQLLPARHKDKLQLPAPSCPSGRAPRATTARARARGRGQRACHAHTRTQWWPLLDERGAHTPHTAGCQDGTRPPSDARHHAEAADGGGEGCVGEITSPHWLRRGSLIAPARAVSADPRPMP